MQNYGPYVRVSFLKSYSSVRGFQIFLDVCADNIKVKGSVGNSWFFCTLPFPVNCFTSMNFDVAFNLINGIFIKKNRFISLSLLPVSNSRHQTSASVSMNFYRLPVIIMNLALQISILITSKEPIPKSQLAKFLFVSFGLQETMFFGKSHLCF